MYISFFNEKVQIRKKNKEKRLCIDVHFFNENVQLRKNKEEILCFVVVVGV